MCRPYLSPVKYVRAVSRLMLVAAVRRIRQPGCKFDEMLVLVNPTQGTEKSTALATLAGEPEWFTDSFDFNLRGREMQEQVAGKWIVEAGELKGLRESNIDKVKTTMSRQVDRGRAAYAHYGTEVERSCVFFGTTNEEKFLKDRTGNRRFLPVRVGRFDIAELAVARNQLWAEAAHYEAASENIRLDMTLWKVAGAVQAAYLTEEPWTEVIGEALGDMIGKVRSGDIWKILRIESGRQSQRDNERIGSAMKELGWEGKRLRFLGELKYCYVKGPEEQRVIYVRRDPVDFEKLIVEYMTAATTTDDDLPL